MKIITNTSLQSWNLPLRTPEGIRHHYLTPGSSIQVPASYLTEYIARYQQRQLISVMNA
jgi:hypothetical protein